jgi:hypothetical protein
MAWLSKGRKKEGRKALATSRQKSNSICAIHKSQVSILSSLLLQIHKNLCCRKHRRFTTTTKNGNVKKSEP